MRTVAKKRIRGDRAENTARRGQNRTQTLVSSGNLWGMRGFVARSSCANRGPNAKTKRDSAYSQNAIAADAAEVFKEAGI